MVIAAFAGAGKTYFCEHVEGAKDLVSMPYKYFLPEIKEKYLEGESAKADPNLEMNPEYPQNYVSAILECMDKYKYLVIPSDGLVLARLRDYDVPYILCYPEIRAKEGYQKRYLQRGNTEDFMDVFIGGWDEFMQSLRNDNYGIHIVLTDKEYLLNARKVIDDVISSGVTRSWHSNCNPYTVGAFKAAKEHEIQRSKLGYIPKHRTLKQRNEEREILISNLKNQWDELTALHQKIARRVNHFTYRYYYRSFKVYSAQEETLQMVDAFKRLLPGCPLNPYFTQIIEAGTNIKFEYSHNSHWVESTTPVLTAFYCAFHLLESITQIKEKDFES